MFKKYPAVKQALTAPDGHIYAINGQVHIWLTDQNYEGFLKYLHKLYSENLLDHAVFTQTYAQYLAKMQNANVGMFFNQTTGPFLKVANHYTGIAPFKGPNGDQYYPLSPIPRDMGAFAITSKDKYPAATMRWLDYFFSKKGSIFFRYGIEGQTFNYDSNGLPQYTPKYLAGASVFIRR